MSIINYALLRSKLQVSPSAGVGICILGGIANGLRESNEAMLESKNPVALRSWDWDWGSREYRTATTEEAILDCSMSFCFGFVKGTILTAALPLWGPVFIYDKVCRPYNKNEEKKENKS